MIKLLLKFVEVKINIRITFYKTLCDRDFLYTYTPEVFC